MDSVPAQIVLLALTAPRQAVRLQPPVFDANQELTTPRQAVSLQQHAHNARPGLTALHGEVQSPRIMLWYLSKSQCLQTAVQKFRATRCRY